VGFPATWTENQLSVELSLVDSKTQKELFTKTYTAKPMSNVSWIYYINSDFNYSEMLQELNKQFCQDIQPVIAGQPKTQ
jgi:phage pi2 protein 07